MKLLKGVTVSILLFLLCIVAPFNIHAAGETQIIPTWSQSSQQSQWSSKFRVTNFCESSNNPQNYSCQLTITVNGDYYGYVYFDGYINNQIIWDYQTMFISGGKGTFYYTWYANGLQQINKVNIAGLNLVSPTDNIDLQQIIDLLTSINNYENRNNVLLDVIDDNTLNTVNEIKNVISQLVISNGYLDTLTKLRQWNIPIESYSFVNYLFSKNYELNYISQYNSYQFPVFHVPANSSIYRYSMANGMFITVVFGCDLNIYNINEFNRYFSIPNGELRSYNRIQQCPISTNNWGYIYNVEFELTSSNTNADFICNTDVNIVPIYFNYDDRYEQYKFISTDFALQFGLSNKLLDNINIIANGTTQSNQQASDLSSGTDSMQQQMNSFTAQEDSYNQQMNNSINAIDFTSPVSQNAGILPAANFVISIFNGLIQNNAFSVLILIVCVLIIGKKVIGK